MHVVAVEVRRECGENRESLLDGVICQGLLADPPGALPTGQKPCRVSLGGGAQRLGAAFDPPCASTMREPAALVAGEHQATLDEKCLQQTCGIAGAAAGTSAV